MRLQIYLPHFGSLPDYFQLYLDSLAHNRDCLTVFLLRQIERPLSGYDIPNNLIHVPMKPSILRERFADCINREYGLKLDPTLIMRSYYKLTDFRPLYPTVFEEIGLPYGKADFIGWGDCDLIYGKLSNFLNCDVYAIGTLEHLGPLCVLKNIDELKRLFRRIPHLPTLLIDRDQKVIEGWIFQKLLRNFCQDNHYEVLNLESVDIAPNYQLFVNVNDIVRQIYVKSDGEMMVTYLDGRIKSLAYCHLQKRRMTLNVERADGGYYIYKNTFSREPIELR